MRLGLAGVPSGRLERQSEARTAFVFELQADLARALGIELTLVSVTSLRRAKGAAEAGGCIAATVKFSLMNVGWAQLREHVCELERQLTNPRSPLMRGKATCLLIAAQEVTVRPTPPPPVDRDSEQIKDYTRELQVRR